DGPDGEKPCRGGCDGRLHPQEGDLALSSVYDQEQAAAAPSACARLPGLPAGVAVLRQADAIPRRKAQAGLTHVSRLEQLSVDAQLLRAGTCWGAVASCTM